MACGRHWLILLALAPVVFASGCIDYVIEAPDSDVILVRGGGERISQMAQDQEQPILQQRQFGLLGGIYFWDKTKFRDALGEGQTLENVGIVTGKHASDMAITLVSSFPLYAIPIVTSNTVRVFSDVQ